VHDTTTTALSYHKLYLITKQTAVHEQREPAWREYFVSSEKARRQSAFVQAREAARRTAIRFRNSELVRFLVVLSPRLACPRSPRAR